jgi:hypothetical protein
MIKGAGPAGGAAGSGRDRWGQFTVTLSAQEQETLEMLEMLIKKGNPPEIAANRLRVMLNDDALVDAVLAERKKILDQRIRIAEQGTVYDPENPPSAWYAGPSDDDAFWPSLKKELLDDPGWRDAVPSLDATSTDVVSLLADPHSEKISTRGLVLGYVQSGKTANFTATIAKAADAGYRLFIVLSGVHNSLRRQTQIRLNAQLCTLQPTQWVSMTDEERDFGNPVQALPLVAGSQLRLLAVVKKNVSRLTNLKNWLLKAHEYGGLDKCPVLIIDDEADQASPNAAKDANLNRTAINALIVELLNLPRVAYAGYTATPFANILANPADLKDIYPRNFIYSLPKPAGYFGPEELFGAQVSEDEATPDSEPHNMIRFVSTDEAKRHVVKTKTPHVPVVTESLADAIRWFLMATAARRIRSGETKHSSMLIHTTMRVDPQNDFVPVLKEHVRSLKAEWESGDTGPWEAQWERETVLEPAERHGLSSVSFQQLAQLIPEVITGTRVVADNSYSSDRLIYSSDPATVIAVGGNTLSRGLTLEGLVSSFFLRSASAYDSALQMGRWFGYRRGYGDLPRIWTTRGLANDFRFLSEVEMDIRQEIERYAGGDASPEQLAVRIQLHPRMQVTAKLKMQFGVQASASFEESRPQTTYFHHQDADAAEQNLKAARTLVSQASRAGSLKETTGTALVFTSVPASEVLDFLDSYDFHPRSEMADGKLRAYVNQQNNFNSLLEWNLAIVTKAKADGPDRVIDLGLDTQVNLIQRSRKKGGELDTANIGALMSRADRALDLDLPGSVTDLSDRQLQDLRNQEGRPLIVLYPISKDSTPKTTDREPLEAVADQIGVAFSFPKAAPGSHPVNAVQVDLRALNAAPDDTDEAYVDNEGSRDEVSLDAQ